MFDSIPSASARKQAEDSGAMLQARQGVHLSMQPLPENQITTAAKELELAVSRLDEVVGALGERLQPVLRPESVTGNGMQRGEASPASPVARHLQLVTDRVETIRLTVLHLIERVDL